MSQVTPTKPYLLRALYEWCTDNGFTPYVVVAVDRHARVPMEFVKDGEIVLNISFEATAQLKIDNDYIHFKARFSGVSRDVVVPVGNVSAIYARENGQGMAFEVTPLGEGQEPAEAGPALSAVPGNSEGTTEPEGDDEPEPPKSGGRPRLTRIK